jgi:hypothetical protein
MKAAKIITIMVFSLVMIVWTASVAEGAQYLTVNGQDFNSITLELGQSCTIEINSDDDSSYVAYVGFENGLVLGTFSHLITEPNAGNSAEVSEYNNRIFMAIGFLRMLYILIILCLEFISSWNIRPNRLAKPM